MAGIDPIRNMKRADLMADLPAQTSDVEADRAGLLVTQAATQRISEVNVVGTSLILTAFLPMLQTTSPSPTIHLLSSASAYIPAPTRPLYGCSKAAQLYLFQTVAIEAAVQAERSKKLPAGSTNRRAHVRFYASVPGTIRSDFRASAVDGSPADVAAYDSSWDSKGKSDVLEPYDLAQRVILAVDRYKEGVEEMPAKYWAARRILPFACVSLMIVKGLLTTNSSSRQTGRRYWQVWHEKSTHTIEREKNTWFCYTSFSQW